MCSRIYIPALGHCSGEEKWAAEISGGKNMGADENDDNITSSTEDKDAHIEVIVKWSTGYGVII